MALGISRKIGESFILSTQDGDIDVRINGVDGKLIRISIDAPKSVIILRSEKIEESQRIMKKYLEIND